VGYQPNGKYGNVEGNGHTFPFLRRSGITYFCIELTRSFSNRLLLGVHIVALNLTNLYAKKQEKSKFGMEKNMNIIEDVIPYITKPKIATPAATAKRIFSCDLVAAN
jgi:hypothetical protein